jgi:hypothetical protein
VSEETTKVKVHKVTLGIVDHDELGADEVGRTLENARYPNRCISPHALTYETKEVDWHDRHPLNIISEQDSAFMELFAGKTIGEQTGESCSGCGRANTWHPDCPVCEKLTELEKLKEWQKRIVALVATHRKVRYWGKETEDIIEEWSKKMMIFNNLTQAARNVLLAAEESSSAVPSRCSYCGAKIDRKKDAHFTQGDLTYCRKCIDEVGI